MYAKFVQGEPLMVDYTPAAAVSAGAVIILPAGNTGVLHYAPRDIAANVLGALATPGNTVYDGACTASASFTERQLLYWDSNAKIFTTSTNSYTSFAGLVLDAQTASATDPWVRFVSLPPVTSATTVTYYPGAAGVIADPGNVTHAIPVTSSGYCPLVTTGAETRTLAAPSYAGQMLILTMKTDGGDCVVTCATGFNQTGNTIATFNDAGDILVLNAIYVGSVLRWRVAANDTVALTGP